MSGPGWFMGRVLGIEPARRIVHSLRPPAGSVVDLLEQVWAACRILGALIPGCDRRLGPLHLGGVLLALVAVSLPLGILVCHFRGKAQDLRSVGGATATEATQAPGWLYVSPVEKQTEKLSD